MRLAELGEFGLIARLAARCPTGSQVLLGIGDDAAALLPTPGLASVTTSDLLLEGVHFQQAWTPPRLLGHKAMAVNLSDLAAMGAHPRWALLTLGLPRDLDTAFLDPLLDGLLAEAAAANVCLVGGDTCASRSDLVLGLTLTGEQRPERLVRRSGARPGDQLWVTGTVGEAGLGLALLRQGERHGSAIERHLRPTPRLTEGIALAEHGLATAMIDLSDGLLADLGHLLEQSAVGARLFLEHLPWPAAAREQAATLADDPWRFPLAGGEDYELLFTIPPEREGELRRLAATWPAPVTLIGELTATPGLLVIDPDGHPYPYATTGYRHFQGD